MDEEALAAGQGWEPQTPEVAALRRFAERENEARQSGREALFDRPVEERVKAGLAVAEAFCVGVERDGKDAVYVFRCKKNDSRFRPGTRVRVSRGDPRRSLARLELVDDRFDGRQYELRFSGGAEEPAKLEGADPWVLDEDAFDLLETELALLREAEEEGLAGWLAGEEPARFEPDDVPSPFAEGLGGSAAEAFASALRAKNWFTVQGPPGSGKTHLLARLALHLALERDLRVLVTAVSHAAIHQALAEVVAVGRRFGKTLPRAAGLLGDGLFKVGSSRGANETLPAGVRPVWRLPGRKRPLIAGATVYGAARAGTSADGRQFDAVLFDEAGQATMTLALGARVLAPLAIYIGDDMQLPPVVELPEDEDDAQARGSVLSFARRSYGAPFLLRETRRLNDELCAAVSACFYDDALAPTPEAAGRRLSLAAAPAGPFAEILRPDRPLVFVDVPHEANKSLAEPEARWAAALAAEAVRCGLPPEEIGLIAPYRSQCNRIRHLLDGRRGLACSTVERFQGQERELIIVSMTSSEPRYLARLAPFLFDPRRLNVAVSRARTKAVVLGARKALLGAAGTADEDAPDSPAARGLAVFRRLAGLAHPVAAGLLPPVVAAPPQAVAGPEVGTEWQHPVFGSGLVLRRSLQQIDRRKVWLLEVRFSDGTVRSVEAG